MTDRIDLDLARRFIATLAGDAEAAVQWQTFSDRKKGLSKDDLRERARTSSLPIRIAQQWLERSQSPAMHAGVFVTVNATDGRGREVANVTGLRALFVDCDGTQPLPQTWPLQPSIIVQRDETHWHAYWLLRDGEQFHLFTWAQVWLACYWRSDWSVSDLPRVMRVPGFLHYKEEPRLVRLVHAERVLYSIDQVVAAHADIDFAALPDDYQTKADNVGCWTMPARSAPRASSRPVGARGGAQVRSVLSEAELAALDDERWQEEMFRVWAMHKDTAPSEGNVHRGRDRAAFVIAAQGAGRGLRRDLVHEVVLDYLQRARADDPDGDADRIVGSAFRKPRHGARPVRPAPRRVEGKPQGGPHAGEDLFAADDGGSSDDPPADGGGGADGADDGEDAAYDGLDLAGLRGRWAIGVDGVVPMEYDGRTHRVEPKVNKRVANLPIWPAQIGRDVATGRTFMRIGWVTPSGETRRSWLPEEQVKMGKPLLDLVEGPVAGDRFNRAAVWLTEARSAITRPQVEVTSRLGWCGINGGRRWVWPSGGDVGVQYIGADLPAHGDLDGWRKGLNHVLGLGEPGFVALTVAALSAAAPWARLLSGQRNPTLGLQARSSSGKGSVIDWGLAIWCDASALTLPATSTAKGIQDRGIDVPDLPIFLDELQQLAESDPRGLALSNAMYYLGNGQQRVRATKTGGAEGGARRYGVGFYAAEAPVLIGRNEGVALRAVELTGDPCPSEATARALRAAAAHSGVLAVQISEVVRSRPVADWAAHLRERAAALAGSFEGLRAGDSDVLALVERGCAVLADCCELGDYPTEALLAWLAARIAEQRRVRSDRESVCLRETLDLVLNLDWQMAERRTLNQRPIAWRSEVETEQDGRKALWASFDCDPSHPALAPLFERAGGEDRVLRAWAERGWIVTQPGRLRVRRRGAGYVVRFAVAGLERAGYEPERAGVRPPAPVGAPGGGDEGGDDAPF